MTKLEKAYEYIEESDIIDYPEDIEILKKNPEVAKLDDRIIQILWSAWSDCLHAGWLMVYPSDGNFLWKFAQSEYKEDNYLLGYYDEFRGIKC